MSGMNERVRIVTAPATIELSWKARRELLHEIRPIRRRGETRQTVEVSMRLPNTAQTSRPWRIHDLTQDFRLEDVWALPTPGGADDFRRLVHLIVAGDPSRGAPPLGAHALGDSMEGRRAARVGQLGRRVRGADAARLVAGGSARRPLRPRLCRARLHLALPTCSPAYAFVVLGESAARAGDLPEPLLFAFGFRYRG